MPEQQGYVRFENVSKAYDAATFVVEDLSLSVAKGEFLTMLGPSGSGKTTSLMMLAGFEQPSLGEIFLDGLPISRVPAHRRDIGMVFQSYALFPHMTVGENLAFPLQVRKVSKAETKRLVSKALGTVKLAHLIDRKPSQLSGGQQQRVALARALIFEPRIVLMDEPLGALDKQLREHMQHEIRALHRRLGITMVYVTHDQDEALTMSDRVAVFGNGRIQQLAPPEELYESPSNAFVASFIGENNSIRGKVVFRDVNLCKIELTDATLLTARTGDVQQFGEDATVSVRPERVVLNPPMDGSTVRLEGNCTDLVYHGDHIRVCIDHKSAGPLVAKIPNARAYQLPKIGDAVLFGWAAEDAIALKQV